jgi:predicted flap endonuclease-1-like 5' DNA nuclease
MGLLDKLKSVLGFDGAATHDPSEVGSGEVTVSVEHEPATDSEDAVKGTESMSTSSKDRGTQSLQQEADDTGDAADESAEHEDAGDTVAEEWTTGKTEDGADGTPVTEINGIGPTYGDRLGAAGVEDVADLASADAATLAGETDIAEGRLETWIEAAGAR